MLRAVHQKVDGVPRILEDPVSFRLLDPVAREMLNTDPDPFRATGASALRSHVVLRSRYAEDCLAEAFARGVRQCVVLGAGLDTFAYRQPAFAGSMLILEVDHPAAQEDKLERLAGAGIEIPQNVIYAPVDFEAGTMAEGMASVGFDSRAATFLSWLGVTSYLTAEAVDAVLAYVAGLAEGSELVFTYSSRADAAIAAVASSLGEPWKSHLEPENLPGKLKVLGFSSVHEPSPEELERRYYAARTDGLPPPKILRLVRALV